MSAAVAARESRVGIREVRVCGTVAACACGSRARRWRHERMEAGRGGGMSVCGAVMA